MMFSYEENISISIKILYSAVMLGGIFWYTIGY